MNDSVDPNRPAAGIWFVPCGPDLAGALAADHLGRGRPGHQTPVTAGRRRRGVARVDLTALGAELQRGTWQNTCLVGLNVAKHVRQACMALLGG